MGANPESVDPMGDLAWQTLGQGGALAAAIALIVWLFRWIVRREREISGEFRETAMEALAASKQQNANQERIMAVQEQQTELLWRILNAIEQSPGTGPRHAASWDGSSGYSQTSERPNDSQRRH